MSCHRFCRSLSPGMRTAKVLIWSWITFSVQSAGSGPFFSMQRGFRFRLRESHFLRRPRSLICQKLKQWQHSHEVGGADRILQVHQITVGKAVAVRFRFVAHLPQEFLRLAGTEKRFLQHCSTYLLFDFVNKLVVISATCMYLLGHEGHGAGTFRIYILVIVSFSICQSIIPWQAIGCC